MYVLLSNLSPGKCENVRMFKRSKNLYALPLYKISNKRIFVRYLRAHKTIYKKYRIKQFPSSLAKKLRAISVLKFMKYIGSFIVLESLLEDVLAICRSPSETIDRFVCRKVTWMSSLSDIKTNGKLRKIFFGFLFVLLFQ